jgi:hypothetical protein
VIREGHEERFENDQELSPAPSNVAKIIPFPSTAQADSAALPEPILLDLVRLDRRFSGKGPLSLQDAAQTLRLSPRRAGDLLRFLLAHGYARRVLIETGIRTRLHRYEFATSPVFLDVPVRRILKKDQAMRMVARKKAPGRPKKTLHRSDENSSTGRTKNPSQVGRSEDPSSPPLQSPLNTLDKLTQYPEDLSSLRSDANHSSVVARTVQTDLFSGDDDSKPLTEAERRKLDALLYPEKREKKPPSEVFRTANFIAGIRRELGVQILVEPKGKMFAIVKRILRNFDKEKALAEMESVGIRPENPLFEFLLWSSRRREYLADWESLGRIESSLNFWWRDYKRLAIEGEKARLESERWENERMKRTEEKNRELAELGRKARKA